MTMVYFNSSIWTDPWFRKLSAESKLLFICLWTNDHKNLIVMYPIDIEIMSFETILTMEEVKKCLSELEPKVKYDKETEIVWVVNHVRHQFMKTHNTSPTIITAIEKALISLKFHKFVDDFFLEYSDLEIRHPDRVSIYLTVFIYKSAL